MKASLCLEAIGDDESAPLSRKAGAPRPPQVGHSPLYRRLAQRATTVRAVHDFMAALAQEEGPPPPRHWCAEVVGTNDQGELQCARLRGQRDYQQANGTGSRGIFVYYLLESGHIYEVSSPQTWRRTDHYFCTVTDAGEILEIAEQEVRTWLLQRQPPQTSDRLE